MAALIVVTLIAMGAIGLPGGDDAVARRVTAVGLLLTSFGLLVSIFLKDDPKRQTCLGIGAGIAGLICIGLPYWLPGAVA